MKLAKENRPVGQPDGLLENCGDSASSITPFTPEMAEARAQGVLMVLVYNPSTDRYRRRLLLSLSAASRVVERAEARGHQAHIVLGRFSVVEVVTP